MEKTLSRETTIQLHVKLDTYYEIFKDLLSPEINNDVKALLEKANCELYPGVNLEQSFSDFKKTLDPLPLPKGPEDYEIPTNDRYDTIPLNTLDTRYGTKEVNQFIP